MTDKAFIESLAINLGKTKKETKEIVDVFEKTLKDSVGEEKIRVADLTFVVKEVAGRMGINPRTKESIEIPAYNKLSVKVSNKFKELINE